MTFTSSALRSQVSCSGFADLITAIGGSEFGSWRRRPGADGARGRQGAPRAPSPCSAGNGSSSIDHAHSASSQNNPATLRRGAGGTGSPPARWGFRRPWSRCC